MATGESVSKANIYTVTSPPDGMSVSKANLYTVTGPPGLSVSKAVIYTVLYPESEDGPMLWVF